jgi:hypothetical protein
VTTAWSVVRRVLGASLLSAVLLCVALGPGAASALAEPAPVWKISQASIPTNFPPGAVAGGVPQAINASPHYTIAVSNLGGAAASVGTTVTDTMSAGIQPATAVAARIALVGEGTTQVYPCEPPSAQAVTCVLPVAVPVGADVTLDVGVDVAVSPPGLTVTNEITVSGGGAAAASSVVRTVVSASVAPFGFLEGSRGLSATATSEDGSAASLAGSHPFAFALEAGFPSRDVDGDFFASGPIKNLGFSLPPGVIFNPQATDGRCTEAQLNSENHSEGCPPSTQVGILYLVTNASGVTTGLIPLYNMLPPPGVPAEFGFNLFGTLVHIQGGLSGDFHLTAEGRDILAKVGIFGVQASMWGDPSDPRHDFQRSGKGCISGGCPVTRKEVPVFTMPSSCSSSLELTATATSWEGGFDSAATTFAEPDGEPLTITGCNALEFNPTIEAKATTNQGESSSGLEFALHQSQDENLHDRATAKLKNVKVALPEGVSLNPAAAGGRSACTSGQIGLEAPQGARPVRFAQSPQSCPSASKLGTVEVFTPLLEHPLPGAVYLAKPFDNPFGSLLAIYLAVEDEESGIIVKLAGKVEADPVTGQLTTTFEESPDLPIEEIRLSLFSGSRAALTTPLTCGIKTTTSVLTPWSTPEGADAYPSDSFQTTGACAASEAAASKNVSFFAGTVSPLAGSYSPFVLRISRPDGTQHITGLEATLPEGLLGKLAGVAYCPESGIAQARDREEPEKGKLEQQNPSCPIASEIGTVQVTAGSGLTPIPVSGHAYLAGPYQGAPLSLVAIVPAVAGPFDLGTVVDRVALNVGEYDARIHAVADPFPTIRDGIPLDIRSIGLNLDRAGFTLNPTSCEAKTIEGSVSTQVGQSAALKNSFQVGECGRLAFKPKISISLKGGTKRAAHPALKATVTYPQTGEYANISRAQVSLPHSEFLDQSNIGKSCTRPVLAAQGCPAKSIYGKVKAWTPLLEKPLEGPVYLVGGYGYKLPALVAELNGQIRVLLVGKVDTDKQKGIRNTFEAVPDAPVQKFVLELKGGRKYGLLVNSENICKKKQEAGALFVAQNGRKLTLSPTIANSCKVKKKTPKKH